MKRAGFMNVPRTITKIVVSTYPVFAKLVHNFAILNDVTYSGVPGSRCTFKISTRNR
jgi:hypothetical protein